MCGGGAQLALDMTTTFDTVPRGALVAAMRWVNSGLSLHSDCSYVIQHGQYRGRVAMPQGVKQGCTLAPLLRAVYSTFLAHCIGMATDYEWMLRCMTIYADDTHVHWEIDSERDLHFMRRCIQVIFSVYTEYGMKVNPRKSIFISGVIRRVGRQWMQSRQSHRSGQHYLDFGGPAGPPLVPQANPLKYLWVIVS